MDIIAKTTDNLLTIYRVYSDDKFENSLGVNETYDMSDKRPVIKHVSVYSTREIDEKSRELSFTQNIEYFSSITEDKPFVGESSELYGLNYTLWSHYKGTDFCQPCFVLYKTVKIEMFSNEEITNFWNFQRRKEGLAAPIRIRKKFGRR